jgi:hypothetical protein
MKKYLILIFCLISTFGFGQEKPIKSYVLFGVKFSVNKNYWLKIESKQTLNFGEQIIVEAQKLNYAYIRDIEETNMSYSRMCGSNVRIDSGQQITSGSYLIRVIIAMRKSLDDESLKIIKIDERVVRF